MSNLGIYQGAGTVGGRDYVPRLRGFSTAGSGITQPILSDPRNTIGHYIKTNQGWIVGWAQITFVAGDSLGSGDGLWGISLPEPTISATDLPIGVAMMWQGTGATPSPLLIGQVTAMDAFLPGGSQGANLSFCQVFLSKLIAFGTATFGSGSTTATVTHGCAETPNAYDIHLTLTNTPSTNPQWFSIQNIGATTFDIIIKASSTTTPAALSWKIEAEPTSSGTFPLLMGSTAPWAWAAGMSIGIQFQYEARR